MCLKERSASLNKIGRAFTPAHISGIFIINEDFSGSTGCGICLEHGALTEVCAAQKTTIYINGVETSAKTTLSTIELLTSIPVHVETRFNIPIGYGFGASGAGALSTALALNEALSLNKTLNELAQLAHVAEVKNLTGLGDVAAQIHGGVVIRKKAGISIIDRIPCRNETVSWVCFGKISTETMLSELNTKVVNRAGKLRLKQLLKKPTLENFFIQSCKFAKELEIMSSKVRDAIEAVEAQGGFASQAMLGDVVFAIRDNGILSEFGDVQKSRISYAGAHVL